MSSHTPTEPACEHSAGTRGRRHSPLLCIAFPVASSTSSDPKPYMSAASVQRCPSSCSGAAWVHVRPAPLTAKLPTALARPRSLMQARRSSVRRMLLHAWKAGRVGLTPHRLCCSVGRMLLHQAEGDARKPGCPAATSSPAGSKAPTPAHLNSPHSSNVTPHPTPPHAKPSREEVGVCGRIVQGGTAGSESGAADAAHAPAASAPIQQQQCACHEGGGWVGC